MAAKIDTKQKIFEFCFLELVTSNSSLQVHDKSAVAFIKIYPTIQLLNGMSMHNTSVSVLKSWAWVYYTGNHATVSARLLVLKTMFSYYNIFEKIYIICGIRIYDFVVKWCIIFVYTVQHNCVQILHWVSSICEHLL